MLAYTQSLIMAPGRGKENSEGAIALNGSYILFRFVLVMWQGSGLGVASQRTLHNFANSHFTTFSQSL